MPCPKVRDDVEYDRCAQEDLTQDCGEQFLGVDRVDDEVIQRRGGTVRVVEPQPGLPVTKPFLGCATGDQSLAGGTRKRLCDVETRVSFAPLTVPTFQESTPCRQRPHTHHSSSALGHPLG
jgi:hypothetical protein